MKIEVSKLVLADLRIYDKKFGVEVDFDMPKVLLIEKDGVYHNVFNEEEVYPLCKRLPYSNTTLDGDSYGTKLSVNEKELEKNIGLCAIEDDKTSILEDCNSSYIDLKNLEDKVINSDLFFKDRATILYKRANELTSKRKARKLMKLVERDYEKLKHYEKQYNRISEDYTKMVFKV